MDAGVIALIGTSVIALLVVLGVWPSITKKLTAVKESADVIIAGIVALSDGKLTAEEIEKIKAEIKEAGEAWKK